MTAAAPPIPVLADTQPIRRAAPWFVLIFGVVFLQLAFATRQAFPAVWDTFFSAPLDRFARWAQANRRTHPLFTGFFVPLTNALKWALGAIQSFLEWVPWYVLVLAVVLLILSRTRDWKRAGVAGVAMLYPGLIGVWDSTIETVALMAISVIICVIIGIPLGVWAAFRPKLERAMRPFLDAMQTVPAPVYFLPMLIFFGVGPVAAAFATTIYALPPLIRLTTLGIRQVPSEAVEASEMFGSSRRQTLFKVQLPMALPTLMTGVSQSIMMALGIVVLATLLAAGGLGQDVMDTLRTRSTGRGLAVGLAIVAVAMVLDRVGRAIAESDPIRAWSRRATYIAVGALVAVVVAGRLLGWVAFPEVWGVEAFDPIDTTVTWARDNTSWLTRPFNDFVVGQIYVPTKDFLTETLAWPVLIFAAGWLAWRAKGWRLALFTGLAIALVGLIGLWAVSLDTLTQVIAAVVFALVIAIPVGVWTGRNPRIEAAIGPVLDAFQTIPSLVYIIPVVTLFTLGIMPGVIASVLYAMVPGIRITALGIRQVPPESIEASRTFGATPRQTMFGVRIPLAAPTILAAINQVIMMVLAMVIIAGLVGGGALGFAIISAVTRAETGNGFELGVAIVVMAMILDRLTQAWAAKARPPPAVV
jgi:glycine betaine/proline transport system permease protein